MTIETVPSIELEMFEVGLGSSIYLRLRRADGDVRILADGGAERGYAANHVQAKITQLLANEDAGRLDLIIGTHYDEDHLRGLVPILNAPIEVGELWLPPVTDDTIEVVGDVAPRKENLLGVRIAGDERHLSRYLQLKLDAIRMCREVEDALSVEIRDAGTTDGRGLSGEAERERLLAWLRSQLGTEGADTGHDDGCEHVDTADVVSEALPFEWPHIFACLEDFYLPYRRFHRAGEHLEFAHLLRREGRHSAAAFSVSRIRRSAAKDAINAIALNDVVQAAKRRNVTIRYRWIAKGRPDVFHWVVSDRRFRRGASAAAPATTLTLLGPSETLILKHANRLPVLEGLTLALVSRIQVKSISPSNQLSYVMKIEHAKQAMLICGDSGFSDFMVTKSAAEPLLLAELRRLHVVQIAHHGGNNQWFYRVLTDAWRGGEAPAPIMLLSHAENDRYRPNNQFAEFLEEIDADDDNRFVVFTSKPLPSRVVRFRERAMPSEGRVGGVGDVRFEFVSGRWTLRRHAVEV